jgi:hypothetical protein
MLKFSVQSEQLSPLGLKGLTRFPGLKFKYCYAVTWTCDWHTWFSLICNLITIGTTPLNNCKFGA